MNIYSVIVCYHPDVPKLLQTCKHLGADGSSVVLVDNTEDPTLTLQEFPDNCTLITLGFNSGIAHAQNIGIEAAINAGANIIAFFDQDSTISADFLTNLTAPLAEGVLKVVSPLYIDDISGEELPSVRVDKFGKTSTIHHDDATEPYQVDIVISSGTAATREVFELAGKFDESFFIDFVDTEWCLRCRAKNIPIYVVPQARMLHRIGSKSIQLGRFTLLVHSPTRCYYQLRNCFHLLNKQHIPPIFALKQMTSVFISRMMLLLFVNNRSAYIKAYLMGIRDGFNGVVGKKSA